MLFQESRVQNQTRKERDDYARLINFRNQRVLPFSHSVSILSSENVGEKKREREIGRQMIGESSSRKSDTYFNYSKKQRGREIHVQE
jgi:hypothetical protein